MDILDESDVKKMSSEFSQGEIFSYIKHEIKPYQIHVTKHTHSGYGICSQSRQYALPSTERA